MAEIVVSAVAPGRCRVEGRVTHTTARAAYHATRAVLEGEIASGASPIELDLSGVASGNSLVLSLMLSWLRLARGSDREIRFVAVPPALEEQIRFTGLNRILPVVRTDSQERATT